MPRIKRDHRGPQPTFLGMPCNGPNIKKAEALEEVAECRMLAAKFYRLSRENQLLMAGAVTALNNFKDEPVKKN